MSKASKFKEVWSTQSITELKVTKEKNTKDIDIKGTAPGAKALLLEPCRSFVNQSQIRFDEVPTTQGKISLLQCVNYCGSILLGNEMIDDSVYKLDHKRGCIALRNFILTK